MKDIFGLVGIGLIGLGVSARYDWELACILVGIIFLALAVIGAMRK